MKCRCSAVVFLVLVFCHDQGLARSVTTQDLATLKDIGGVHNGVSVSHNGFYALFNVHQGDPVNNRYSNQWMLADLKTKLTRVLIEDAGEPTAPWADRIGGSFDDYHHFAVISPVWTPDDKAFYYARKTQQGRIRLYCRLLTGKEEPISTVGDVIDLRPIRVGYAIVQVQVTSDSAIQASKTALRDGLLFRGDIYGTRHGLGWPEFAGKRETREYLLNLRTKRLRPLAATTENGTVAIGSKVEIRDSNKKREITINSVPQYSPDESRIAWEGMLGPESDLAIFVSRTDGTGAKQVSRIRAESYTSISWSGDGKHIYFVSPSERTPASKYTESDIFMSDAEVSGEVEITRSVAELDDCSFATSVPVAACTIETLVQPQELAMVDLRTGAIVRLSNLNDAYNRLDKPRTEPITWSTASGDDGFGVLTYPLGYRRGESYPLVIAVYHHPGFERGSNGDEFPIAVLSAHGFFVLDFSMTPYQKYWKHSETPMVDFDVAYDHNLASVSAVISELSARGDVDSRRVGLCGLSAGTNLTLYALSRANLVSSAIVAGIFITPMYNYLQAEEEHNQFVAQGFGANSGRDNWAKISAPLNADHITTPLLINAPQTEFLTSLETYFELHDRNRPVELWVYKDEFHQKYQPAHTLAVYNRNVDWFDFWLNGREDPTQSKAEQYKRWRELRRERDALDSRAHDSQ